METASIIYNGELRTTATHLRSGTVIETDAPVDNKVKEKDFLLLTWWPLHWVPACSLLWASKQWKATGPLKAPK